MATTLRVLAEGDTDQAKANARGKLFEALAADLLRLLGYKIDTHAPNVNFAGMEIDIEGTHSATQIPVYAECKCYSTDVDSPKLHAFFGKYMAKWLSCNKAHGFFLALPGLNSHARGFWADAIRGRKQPTLVLQEEPQVIENLITLHTLARPAQLASDLKPAEGTPGDTVLLYTNNGFFWVQYVVPPGSALASTAILYDSGGDRLVDRASIDKISSMFPDIEGFPLLNTQGPTPSPTQSRAQTDQVVEVQRSSSCFEYHYPAAPEFFVGRNQTLQDIDSFIAQVLNKTTSARGILFLANSGWGKSSAVLATIDRIRQAGHHAVALDCRSASTPQFTLRAIEYALARYRHDNLPLLSTIDTTVAGFSSVRQTLVTLGHTLESQRRLLVIFFDQFENLFFHPSTLQPIRDLLLGLCNASTNVVLGFAWKTDLVGVAHEFPYLLRDSIANNCQSFPIPLFAEKETADLLKRLEDELHATLRADLRFFLSEFSRGYPWLLKKLCAHVKTQRDRGVTQAEIASRVLNVEELFLDDIRTLSPEQETTLRAIARRAPIGVDVVGDVFDTAIVQALVDDRLLIKIGPKYDIYWDIFRDYLNSGHVPVEENYLLRLGVGSVVRPAFILLQHGSPMTLQAFRTSAKLTDKSFFNLIRDMRLAGIVTVDDQKATLAVKCPVNHDALHEALRALLKDRLGRNRITRALLAGLESRGTLTNEEAGRILQQNCPYISAEAKTWNFYARVMSDWLDFAGLLVINRPTGDISAFDPTKEVRQKRPFRATTGGRGIAMPPIQVAPIVNGAERITKALRERKPIDWTGIAPSTKAKVLAALEAMGWISVHPDRITVRKQLTDFASHPSNRPAIFADAVKVFAPFAQFLRVISSHKAAAPAQKVLAAELQTALGTQWAEGTALVHVKVMLDWARFSQQTPSSWGKTSRGRRPKP